MFIKREILFLLFLAVFPFFAEGQVTASFTASQTAGCSPMIVSFNNTSTGATSYSWNFGNGNPPSTLTNPSSSYSVPNTYTVTLTAYNGSTSSTATTTITVYPVPTVSFFAVDTLVCPGVAVTFSNTSNPNATGPATYSWNFGDGTTSPAQNPSHVFPGPGYYSITLTVTNSQGCTSTLTQNAYIHVETPPVANFYANNVFFCKSPGLVSFTNLSTGVSSLSYTWKFGDGQTSPATSPTHTYWVAGNYTVRLIVTDLLGCIDSMVKPNYIKIDSIAGSIIAPDSGCIYQTVSFSSTPAASTSTNWYFGDGGTATGVTATHIYGGTGTYTVSVVVFDGICYDTVNKPVFIRPQPTISFTYSPLHPCPNPVTVNFTSSAPPGSAYSWSFGDGSPGSALANPSHLYVNNGFYANAHGGWDSVVLTVTDSHGCMNTFVDTVIIEDLHVWQWPPDSAGFAGCVPRTVHFPKVHSYSLIPVFIPPAVPPFHLSADSTISFIWNFGDGSPTTTQVTPTHTYSVSGNYKAYVTATTLWGCVAVDTFPVWVGTKPIITSFTVSPSHVCRNDTVTCIGHATGDTPLVYHYYIWSGSATGSTTLYPPDDTLFRIKLTLTGTYQIYLTVSNLGCVSDTSTKYTVTVDSPSAGFYYKIHCGDSGRVVSCFDTSHNANTMTWLFSDGTTSNQTNPVHTFPSLGYWNIKQAVYNSTSGCHDTVTEYVHLFNLNPVFNDTTICKGTTVNIQPAFSPGPLFTSIFNWYVDSGLQSHICNCPCICTPPPPIITNFIYTFDSVKPNYVKLILQDSSGCYDTIRRTFNVVKPHDSLAAIPIAGCLPLTVNFTDHSSFPGGTSFANSFWDFGDGTNITVTTTGTSHTYYTQGFYNVEEIVTDNIGCKDTLQIAGYINVDKAHAQFSVSNQFPCKGDTIFFSNSSYNYIVSSRWFFGDGDSSSMGSPSHAYMDTGSYTVTLIVTDNLGCSDTLVQNAYIQVTKPHATFTMNDSTGICIPMNVVFTNNSTGATGYLWNFGNGNSSPATNPVNSYSVPAYDTVMLIATNSHGCKDTAYKHVILYGYSSTFSYSPLFGCKPLLVNFTATVVNIPYLQWDFSDGFVSPVSSVTAIAHTYNTPGAYVPKLILSDSSNCHVSDIGLDTIKVDSVAARYNFTPVTICVFDTVHFRDSSSSMFSVVNGWQWIFNNGATSNLQDPNYQFSNAGANLPVMLIATDAWGCKDTLSKLFTVLPLPIITAAGDTTVCVGDIAPLSSAGGLTYNWSPSVSLSCGNCRFPNASPSATTMYIVKGTDANGCSNTDSVEIKTKTTITSKVGIGGEICDGGSVLLSDSGALSYTWYPAESLDNNQSATPVATPHVTTKYIAIAKTASCKADTNFVTVTVDPLPQVNAGNDQTIIEGNTAVLQASATYAKLYIWRPADGLSCDTCSDPTVNNIHQTTTFTVIVYSKLGCIDSAQVTVHVICDHSQVFIPNSFTPNGDGQNDVFYPRGVGVKTIKSFRVYDRWGELIFERKGIALNDESNGWDGTYKGGRPRPDVYVYAIDAICETGEELSWKGDVTIIR